MGPAEALEIEVVFSDGPRRVWRWSGRLAEGATVADALRASGVGQAHPGLDVDRCEVGVWARRCTTAQPLRDGDRVEIYRALKVDPKEARRLRYRQHLAAADARRKAR